MNRLSDCLSFNAQKYGLLGFSSSVLNFDRAHAHWASGSIALTVFVLTSELGNSRVRSLLPVCFLNNFAHFNLDCPFQLGLPISTWTANPNLDCQSHLGLLISTWTANLNLDYPFQLGLPISTWTATINLGCQSQFSKPV